jgi:hypothetical protein
VYLYLIQPGYHLAQPLSKQNQFRLELNQAEIGDKRPVDEIHQDEGQSLREDTEEAEVEDEAIREVAQGRRSEVEQEAKAEEQDEEKEAPPAAANPEKEKTGEVHENQQNREKRKLRGPKTTLKTLYPLQQLQISNWT